MCECHRPLFSKMSFNVLMRMSCLQALSTLDVQYSNSRSFDISDVYIGYCCLDDGIALIGLPSRSLPNLQPYGCQGFLKRRSCSHMHFCILPMIFPVFDCVTKFLLIGDSLVTLRSWSSKGLQGDPWRGSRGSSTCCTDTDPGSAPALHNEGHGGHAQESTAVRPSWLCAYGLPKVRDLAQDPRAGACCSCAIHRSTGYLRRYPASL